MDWLWLILLFSIDKLYVFLLCLFLVMKCMKFPLQPKSIFLAIRCMVSLKAIASSSSTPLMCTFLVILIPYSIVFTVLSACSYDTEDGLCSSHISVLYRAF